MQLLSAQILSVFRGTQNNCGIKKNWKKEARAHIVHMFQFITYCATPSTFWHTGCTKLTLSASQSSTSPQQLVSTVVVLHMPKCCVTQCICKEGSTMCQGQRALGALGALGALRALWFALDSHHIGCDIFVGLKRRVWAPDIQQKWVMLTLFASFNWCIPGT